MSNRASAFMRQDKLYSKKMILLLGRTFALLKVRGAMKADLLREIRKWAVKRGEITFFPS
jgi:hypothetical protein